MSNVDTKTTQKRPVRVLHHLGSLNRGGIETWLLQVLRKCDPGRVRMDFLVRSQQPGEYSAEIRALGSRILTCYSHRNPVAFANKVQRLLRGLPQYDVLHSHLAQYDGVSMWIARRMQIPIRISHSHNDTRAITRTASVPWRIYCASGRMLIRSLATHRIAASARAALSLFGEVPGPTNRIGVLHCGIDTAQFAAPSGRDELFRTSLGIPPGSYVVGHVGRFEPQKNHSFMIDLARSVVNTNPNVHFLFAGTGALEAECKSRVAANELSGHVTFLGSRPDIPKLMKNAMDLFILPSLHEGLPIVLLETQAAGLRSLVSDAVTEEAAISPETIKFLPLASGVAEWASEILSAAANGSARSCAARSCPLKGTDFDIDVSTRRLMSLYQA